MKLVELILSVFVALSPLPGMLGASEIITLGASGDVVIRNNDESAKPLYLLLRKSFPHVTSYRNDRHMAPYVGE